MGVRVRVRVCKVIKSIQNISAADAVALRTKPMSLCRGVGVAGMGRVIYITIQLIQT